jgi:ubiquinone/menaquinone biosynthesis C-methylase UbiE
MPVLSHHETSQAREQERRELDRIRQAYEHRRNSIPSDRYARTNPAHLYALHEREAAMAALLRAAGLPSLAGLRILDIGCGRGAMLRQYLEYDADPARVWGIDLLPAFNRQAQRLAPHLRIACASAAELPFPDASFDFVSQFVLFTSVLSSDMKHQMANEIHRVLVRRGKFLWYDFAYNNPNNPNVRGIGLAEVRELFPGFSIARRRITLAPPIGRAIGRFGPAFYYVASKMRFLCTHYLCLLEKQ